MGTTQPIRRNEEIEQLKEYFFNKEVRNYVLITMGINTALRISALHCVKLLDIMMHGRMAYLRQSS